MTVIEILGNNNWHKLVELFVLLIYIFWRYGDIYLLNNLELYRQRIFGTRQKVYIESMLSYIEKYLMCICTLYIICLRGLRHCNWKSTHDKIYSMIQFYKKKRIDSSHITFIMFITQKPT